MKRTLEYFDWIQDVQPEILKNLNELLVKDGIEPLKQLNGGTFKDGKWVSVMDSNDYRNYWHLYLDLWGEHLTNDQFQVVYFPFEHEWEYAYERADKFCSKERSGYEHSDPHWGRHLVTAVRKWIEENVESDEYGSMRVVFWWSW